jgi:hypothetical protein
VPINITEEEDAFHITIEMYLLATISLAEELVNLGTGSCFKERI